MILHVVEAKYLHDYIIWVRFNDGTAGEIDLEEQLYGEMFELLRAPDKFKTFKVDSFLGTLVWENGADLGPEFLHAKAKSLV
ncbi:MAG: DUF2442 domain-containing protein [candidate division KSB1 bacterium]|nr:DUF2442 domain-containing protein [candidate division KSB1 bacterium]